MSEWKEKTLGELSIRVSSGLTPLKSKKEFWENPSIPWLKTDQLGEKYIFDTNTKISKEALEQTSLRIYPENTISIAMYGEGKTRGNLSIIKAPMTTNQACCNIEIDPKLADVEYVYYYLKTQYDSLRKLSSGVRKNLNSNDIKNYKIYIPESVSAQKSIVRILMSLDNKISLNNQINQELEAMAKTLYDYWFVQFDFPDQNGKPYKSSGGKMVYNPELKREIPEGWGVARLDQLQITTGKRDANFGTENGKYDFWTTANSPIKADEFSFEGKAILIAGNGNFYVNFTDGKFEAYQRTYVIQSEDEKMLIFMYMACLQSAEKLRKASNGSIIKYITIGDVNNISSPYDHNVVDEFVKIYRPLIDQISKNKKQNQELTQLRDWLLPMLMNGQVKVE
ncbi:restriction endonuclease subunit S [Streptococcus thermophilus]|uniref:restriction endonuclease subunit S n=1 Tax=Streptococcus thermophilus TaxID=1308 RepID=UPI0021824826|nr:restriction endonuclease subunit S [Streptococcus thermophilus]MCS8612732.1 restriction endonuclease subunit S [Streptococcus thermophilus]